MEMENALSRMRRWSGNASSPPGPERISAFLTNKCNLHCRHCWRKWADWDHSAASELPDARWLRLVDEAADMDTRHWIFLGGGEPLVRRALMMQMLDRMAVHEMTSWIHTNGTLFTVEMMDSIMDKRVLEIIFSIDAPDAETNDYIRGGGFEKAISSMRYITECKKRLDLGHPGLFLNATLTNLTCDKLDRFVDLAASIDPNVKVFLSALIVEDEETARLALSPEQKAALPERLNIGINRARELGVSVNFDRFLDGKIIEDNMNMQREINPARQIGLSGALCYEPWLSAAILPDGSLGPCCAFYDPEALSIRDHSLKEVWMGAYMQWVREGMFNGKPPGYCVRCPSNLFVDKERTRIFLTKQLRRDQQTSVKRFAEVVKRGVSVLLNQGMRTFMRKAYEWVLCHLRK